MELEENKETTTPQEATGAPETPSEPVEEQTPPTPPTPVETLDSGLSELIGLFKQMMADIQSLKNVGAPIVGDNTTPQPSVVENAEQTHDNVSLSDEPESDTKESIDEDNSGEPEETPKEPEDVEEEEEEETEDARAKVIENLFTY